MNSVKKTGAFLVLAIMVGTQQLDAMVDKWNRFVAWSGLSSKLLYDQPQAIKTYIKPIEKDFATKTAPILVKKEPIELKDYEKPVSSPSLLGSFKQLFSGKKEKYIPIHQSTLTKIQKPTNSEKEKFMGMAQEALVQSQKSLDRAKKIPTVTPTLPQLTMSMIHLTRYLDGYVTLTPQDAGSQSKQPWLWNNGTGDVKTHTLTYKNKVYTSTYDPEKKTWVATKPNQMSYLTYYEYLIDTNKMRLADL